MAAADIIGAMDALIRLRELAKKDFGIDASALDPATPLRSLKIDSLAFVEFVFKVEEEFGVSLPDDHVNTISTLGDLERCVSDALAAAGKV